RIATAVAQPLGLAFSAQLGRPRAMAWALPRALSLVPSAASVRSCVVSPDLNAASSFETFASDCSSVAVHLPTALLIELGGVTALTWASVFLAEFASVVRPPMLPVVPFGSALTLWLYAAQI